MSLEADAAHVLRDPTQFEQYADRHGHDAFTATLVRHGIAPFVAFQRPDLPRLAVIRRDAMVQDALLSAELRQICSALAAAQVRVLVLKGCAWAYSVYPVPWSRPRADIDLLVHPSDRTRAHDVLLALGFVQAHRVSGDLVSFQQAYSRTVAGGFTCAVDLHWMVTNRLAVGRRLDVAALFANSRPLDAAGEEARELDLVDAITVACLHPLAHHPDDVELKWWLDVVLLAQQLSPGDVEALVQRAAARGVSPLLAHALEQAGQWALPAGTRPQVFEPSVLTQLTRGALASGAAGLLRSSRGHLDDLMSDLGALPTWSERVRLVREHLLPPSAFMLGTPSGSRSRLALPWLYTRRIVSGGGRWLVAWVRYRITRGRE